MFYKTKPLIKKLDPAIFFIPGLIGLPLGAVGGAYHGLTDTQYNKNLVSHVSYFTACIVGGSVIGGILGTIWPISFTSMALISTFKKG